MKRLLLALAVAAGLFPATRGAAQQRDSLAATVERLSAEVETLKGRSAAADRILSRLPRISGYLQLGYEWSDDASTFFVKRARVDFQGDISPKIDYRLQLEFASPKIVDIYLRYKPLEALNVQVGQFKVPVLDREHALRAAQIRIHRIFDGGLPPDGVHRRLRCQRHGTRPGRTALRRIDRPRRIQHPQLQRRRIQRRRDQHQGQEQEQGRRGAADGSTPARALFRGILLLGRSRHRLRRRTRYGGGVCYDDGRWIARGEYIAGRTGIVSPDVATPFDSRGYYAMAACWVTPKWLPAARFEQFDEVAGRSASRQTNYTAGVTWQPFKHLRCQLNYIYEQYGGTNPDRNVVKAMLTGIF